MFAILMFVAISLLVALMGHLAGALVVVAHRRVRLWISPLPKARRKHLQRPTFVREVRQALLHTLYVENLAFAGFLTAVCRTVLFVVSLALMAWWSCRASAQWCASWVRAAFRGLGSACVRLTAKGMSLLGHPCESTPADGTLREQLEQSLRDALENGRPQLAAQR